MGVNFQPIKTISRSQYVFDTIKNAIFSGQLQPGAMLRELSLARQFDVSQATVREALFQLEQIGLAVKIPHKGTIVTKLSDDEIKDMIEVRTHLEKLACFKAMEHLTESDFKHLQELANAISEAVASNQYFECQKADLNFHRFIWKKSQNDILVNTLEQITTKFFAQISVNRSLRSEDLKRVISSHVKYIKALQSRDKEKIEKMLNEHSILSYRKAGVSIPTPLT